MDEIEYKLKTNNSILIVNAIEKLISTVKSKYKPAERQKFVLENEELKFLREKCTSKETVVSLTACQGLLALVECGVLEIGHTMSTVITLLPSAYNYSAIVSTMAGLLILDLKSRLVPGQAYTCQFSLRSPQHPFITVLERNKDAAEDVLTQMHALCTHPDYIVSSHSLQMLRPVFLWLCTLGGPTAPWSLLLAGERALLLHCLCWQQIYNPKLLPSAFAAYSTVTEAVVYQKQDDFLLALLPMLARISNELIRHGRDPRPCYALLDHAPAALTLAMLADNLGITCALHLQGLLNLGLNLISKYELPSITVNMFVALMLQWLHLPSTLTTEALKIASKILETHQNTKYSDRLYMPNLQANKNFQILMYSDVKLSITFKLLKTWERIRDDPSKLNKWIDNITVIDDNLKLELVSFLLGVVMEKRKEEFYEEITLKTLRILVNLVDYKKELSVQLLPVLLYKVVHDSSPAVKMECLKALPLMAKTKENVPTIVSILKKLKATRSVPTSFLIGLYTSLVEVQVRCFPYLQELLVDSTTGPDDLRWEIDIARAEAVKRICEMRPSQGVELVSVISSTLNRCKDSAGAVAAARALLALRDLWRARAVGPVSTWAALRGPLADDMRPTLVASLCELLGEVPSLRVSTPEYEALVGATGARLWRVLARGGRAEVAAACRALANYSITMYTLKDIPEIFRRTVRLPPSYCKTPIDAARKPEDVLDYIPCEVWPEVYKHTDPESLPDVEFLVSRLIEVEVRGYRSGVYRPDVKTEPETADYLPPYSVVRGLLNFLRKESISPSYSCGEPALLQIASTLSRPYPRPLPPLDLCFVHALHGRGGRWPPYVVALAARQAATSGSGRRFIDNYLLALHPDTMEETDILTFFELLPPLCRNMPPNSLRAPLERCLTDSYSKILNLKAKDHTEEEIKELMFVKEMELIRVCLECEKIHDANRTLLSQIVENYYTVLSDDNVAWVPYTRTVCALSTATAERLTSPSSWWEVSGRTLRAAATVRAYLAAHGLAWLDEILDAAASTDYLPEQEYILRCIADPLRVAKREPSSRRWLLQLMARTQVAFAESEEESAKTFFWDVFMLSVILMSGLWSFEPDVDALLTSQDARCSLFPTAVASLFQREEWKEYAPQVVECLCHTRAVHSSPAAAQGCTRALAALRSAVPAGGALWARAIALTPL